MIAAKFLRPRRWDLVVFHSPDERSTPVLKRLVGLPGEEIAIRDGTVWIDGKPADRPAEIAGIVYTADPRNAERQTWGPARLGQEEFFVLGDFSRRSLDSRVWKNDDAAGPVTEADLIGVATHTYWPPSRWRVFR